MKLFTLAPSISISPTIYTAVFLLCNSRIFYRIPYTRLRFLLPNTVIKPVVNSTQRANLFPIGIIRVFTGVASGAHAAAVIRGVSQGSSVSSGGGSGPPPPSPQSVQSSISATTTASAVPQFIFSPVKGSVSQQLFISRLYQYFPCGHENPSLLGRSQKRSDD